MLTKKLRGNELGSNTRMVECMLRRLDEANATGQPMRKITRRGKRAKKAA